VKPDAFLAASVCACDRHVNPTGLGWVGEDFENEGGRVVAQQRSRSTGEHRGHLACEPKADRSGQIHALELDSQLLARE
jgi:hypothetical protein